MDFGISKEQKMICKNVREFMTKEIAPVTEEIDRDDKFPEGTDTPWSIPSTGYTGMPNCLKSGPELLKFAA